MSFWGPVWESAPSPGGLMVSLPPGMAQTGPKPLPLVRHLAGRDSSAAVLAAQGSAVERVCHNLASLGSQQRFFAVGCLRTGELPGLTGAGSTVGRNCSSLLGSGGQGCKMGTGTAHPVTVGAVRRGLPPPLPLSCADSTAGWPCLRPNGHRKGISWGTGQTTTEMAPRRATAAGSMLGQPCALMGVGLAMKTPTPMFWNVWNTGFGCRAQQNSWTREGVGG